MNRLPRFYLLLLIGLSTLLNACSSPVSYNTDYSTGYNFDHFSTYAWQPGEKAKRRSTQPLIDQRIIADVNSTLQEKGFSKDTSAPDFYVNYSIAANDKVDIKQYEVYEGYDPGWIYYPVGFGGPANPRVGWGDLYGGTESEMVMYTTGTLVLDIIDAETGRLVWRGAAEGKLKTNYTPKERDRVIHDVVEHLLSQFPPK